MNRKVKEHHNPYHRRVGQRYYQKGYADGYKRYHNRTKTEQEKTNYMYTVGLVLVIFVLFILIAAYMYNPHIMNPGSNYKDDCLLDLVTTYHTEGCLDR